MSVQGILNDRGLGSMLGRLGEHWVLSEQKPVPGTGLVRFHAVTGGPVPRLGKLPGKIDLHWTPLQMLVLPERLWVASKGGCRGGNGGRILYGLTVYKVFSPPRS